MHLPVDKCITIALALCDALRVLSDIFLHAGKSDDFSTRNGKDRKE